MHAQDAVSLLIIALGAFAIPLISGRIGIPFAVGEIIFGIIIGPHVLGLIHENTFTTFLAEFGFAFLMFLVGLELQFSRIEREGVNSLTSTRSCRHSLHPRHRGLNTIRPLRRKPRAMRAS